METRIKITQQFTHNSVESLHFYSLPIFVVNSILTLFLYFLSWGIYTTFALNSIIKSVPIIPYLGIN